MPTSDGVNSQGQTLSQALSQQNQASEQRTETLSAPTPDLSGQNSGGGSNQ